MLYFIVMVFTALFVVLSLKIVQLVKELRDKSSAIESIRFGS